MDTFVVRTVRAMGRRLVSSGINISSSLPILVLAWVFRLQIVQIRLCFVFGKFYKLKDILSV